jgi:hypothetical protein
MAILAEQSSFINVVLRSSPPCLATNFLPDIPGFSVVQKQQLPDFRGCLKDSTKMVVERCIV